MVPIKTMLEFDCNGNETSIRACMHNLSDSCKYTNRTKLSDNSTIEQSEIRNVTYNPEMGAGVECTSEEQGENIN